MNVKLTAIFRSGRLAIEKHAHKNLLNSEEDMDARRKQIEHPYFVLHLSPWIPVCLLHHKSAPKQEMFGIDIMISIRLKPIRIRVMYSRVRYCAWVSVLVDVMTRLKGWYRNSFGKVPISLHCF